MIKQILHQREDTPWGYFKGINEISFLQPQLGAYFKAVKKGGDQFSAK